MDEIALKAELLELLDLSNEISGAISADSSVLLDLEAERCRASEMSDFKFEDFETGIFNLSKTINLYKAQRNVNIYTTRITELQETYFDSLLFGMSTNKIGFLNEQDDFDSVKTNLIESLLFSITVISKQKRTDAMNTFAKKYKDSPIHPSNPAPKFNGLRIDSPMKTSSVKQFSKFDNSQSPNSLSIVGPYNYSESNPDVSTSDNFIKKGGPHSESNASPPSGNEASCPITSSVSTPVDTNYSRYDTVSHSRSQGLEYVNGNIAPNPFANDVRIVSHSIVRRGIDTFAQYTIIARKSSGGNITVLRRYSDFVNLRFMLTVEYPLFRTRIPKLPPKRVLRNFDPQFLQKREQSLQYFLAYVVLHPVLGSSVYVELWFTNNNALASSVQSQIPL
ncbi:Sorting nexin MVP1 [Smittium mucronatum]|uniref:Sorting nexin MVP1 n=1 Tax=Smittium mucronatum TaxID=133383 RepID=A0A1R0GXY8_9FUNG|nr:Sorting nexin MVP1 [Smittium mucronatum]